MESLEDKVVKLQDLASSAYLKQRESAENASNYFIMIISGFATLLLGTYIIESFPQNDNLFFNGIRGLIYLGGIGMITKGGISFKNAYYEIKDSQRTYHKTLLKLNEERGNRDYQLEMMQKNTQRKEDKYKPKK